MVHHEEVPAVEEGVAFGQDVSQDLLLRLLGIARVAVEGGVLGDFDDQQPRLTFGEGEEGWGQSTKHLGAGERHPRAPPGMLPFSLVLFWCHQDDGDKDQENLMYLHPLLSLPCQKRPWQGSSLLTGPDADAESSLVPYGFVLLHVVLDQLKGSEALGEKSVCRKEKNYFFPPFSGGKGWKKRVLQLLLNTVEAGDQELRPGGLSWGYEGVHVTTGTPKNGL